jgi:hypothetical protein
MVQWVSERFGKVIFNNIPGTSKRQAGLGGSDKGAEFDPAVCALSNNN